MTLELAGVGIGRAIVMGKAVVIERFCPNIQEYYLAAEEVEDEVARFNEALHKVRTQLMGAKANAPADLALILDAQLLMLQDGVLTTSLEHDIRTLGINAAWALDRRRRQLALEFAAMDDPYLRAREVDLRQVVEQVLAVLLGQPQVHAANVSPGQILVAEDLLPADAVLLEKERVKAFVTDLGGPTAHTAIAARTLQIPAVLGMRHATQYIKNGDYLVVDAANGVVLADPSALVLEQLRVFELAEREQASSLSRLRDIPAETVDGVEVILEANIELPEDVHMVREVGAEGVGLFRTEFLFMGRDDYPTEEEQFEAYRYVIELLNPLSVTIRTLDIGADKQLFSGVSPAGLNPALGLRAVRLSLRMPDVFRRQLRAIFRASAYGPVRILIPMLSSVEEMRQVRLILDEVKRDLSRQGLAFDPDTPVGGMIEVPAVAMAAQKFTSLADFFSIGTNDLIQYALAVDRSDGEVGGLYDPFHPGILSMIKNTVEAADKAGISVSMCGEMAGDPLYTEILLGLGLRRLSMHPLNLPAVKESVRRANIPSAEQEVRRLLL